MEYNTPMVDRKQFKPKATKPKKESHINFSSKKPEYKEGYTRYSSNSGNKCKSHTKSHVLNQEDFDQRMVLKDIYQIEIELSNKCNLACPLCSRNNKEMTQYLETPKEINYEYLISALKQFPNLKKVHLVGSLSEPTLYIKFFELCTWLKDNDINIMISTNASTMNEDKFKRLGTILDEGDEVRFAIDGSTQELHERYRRRGNLQKTIKNFLAFADSKAYKVLQTIKFKHNEDIYQEEIEKIQEMCNNKFDFVYELSTNSENVKFDLEYPKKDSLKVKLYKRIFKEATKKNSKLIVSDEIDCFSKDGFIYINHLGRFITCCDRYEEFLPNLKAPNIYDFDMDYLLDYLNGIYQDVPKTTVCIAHCHKLVQQLEQDRDILSSKVQKGAFSEK